MKFIIKTGGGLGDICYDFLHDDYLSKCKEYTQMFLNSYVKLLIVSHNPNSSDLFKGQEWIDEVKQVEYTHTIDPYLSEFEGFIEPKYNEMSSLDNSILEPYLTSEEKDSVNELCKERYVILHPFAGQKDRNCISKELLEQIIEVNTKNYKVYLIGANYDRIHHKEEINEIDNPNVVDLIDKLSIRQLIKLVENENCIGIHCTHSMMCILAWHFRKPNITYYPVSKERKRWDAQELIESPQKTKWNFGKNYKLTQMIPIIV